MNPEPQPERNGPSGLVIGSILALLVGCALVFGLVFLFSARPSTDQQIAAIHARNPAFNLEQTTPNADAQALAATQEALLQGYDWVDQSAGIAHIPIDRAMALIVAEQPEQTTTPQP